MTNIISIFSRQIPEKFKKVEGMGTYLLLDKNKLVVARGIGASKEELSEGLERILIPCKKENGLWDIKLELAVKQERKLDLNLNYSDFPFLEGLANFPKFTQSVLFKGNKINEGYTVINHFSEIKYSVYIKNYDAIDEYVGCEDIDLQFGDDIAYNVNFFLEGTYSKDIDELRKIKIKTY